MKALLPLLLCLATLVGCTALDHTAQAPRRPRHHYEHAQRRHEHVRRRAHHLYLPWN